MSAAPRCAALRRAPRLIARASPPSASLSAPPRLYALKCIDKRMVKLRRAVRLVQASAGALAAQPRNARANARTHADGRRPSPCVLASLRLT